MRAVRRAGLRINVLDVAASGFARDDQFVGDGFRRQAAGEQSQHLEFTLRQSPRSSFTAARDAVAGSLQNRVGGIRVDSTGGDFGAEHTGCLVRGQWTPMASKFPQRVVQVGGAQESPGGADRAPRQASGIAGTVESLMMLNGNRRWRSEYR
jgi:hypothetical protein